MDPSKAGRSRLDADRSRTIASAIVPWPFVIVFGFAYSQFLWPRLFEGNVLPAVIAVIVGVVFLTFAAAALTWTSDAVRSRLP